MSLSARLLLLVLLAMIPAVCVEIYGQIELRSSRRQEIRDDALRLMRLAASEQARIGEGARQLLIAFSEAAPVRAGDWQGCSQIAARASARRWRATPISAWPISTAISCARPCPCRLATRRGSARCFCGRRRATKSSSAPTWSGISPRPRSCLTQCHSMTNGES